MIRQKNSVPEMPTTSLYLQDSLRQANPRIDWESCRAGPFSFRFSDCLVIVRYATETEVALARTIRSSGGRVIYVIDDDLESMASDSRLPEDYRSRIGAFLSGYWQALLELITEVVVSSPPLSDKMRDKGFESVTQLDPYWNIPRQEVRRSASSSRPAEIAWLCSRSHLTDLELIADDLAAFLCNRQDARLTVLLGKNLPVWLKKLRRVKNLKPLCWPEYRQWISGRRFDIALYPLRNTEVNRSRSVNKYLEHTVVGAASIISTSAPFADRILPGNCLFAEEGEWAGHLESLLGDRDRIIELADRAQNRAREISEAARIRQIKFWSERLPAFHQRDPPNSTGI